MTNESTITAKIGKKQIGALDGIDILATEIVDSMKSKGITVQQAIFKLDRARDLLMQCKVI